MDYRDVNRASSRDEFPVLHMDVLVDSTAQFSVFTFMDGFLAKIKWNCRQMIWSKQCPSHQRVPSCYKVKKKAGATDQRATVTLFHDMTHRESECHVDDMMTKSQAEEGHPVDQVV